MDRGDSWTHGTARAAGPSALTTVRQAVKQRDTEGASPMASVEQQTPATANGAAGDIAVENPATGRVIGTVPDLGPEQVADLARRGRAAQPAWEALGFDGRGHVLRRAQRWLMDERRPRDRHDRLRDRQGVGGRAGGRGRLRRAGVRVLGEGGAEVPRRRAREVGVDLRRRQAARAPLPPARPRRRDRAVELPADQLVRRLHPGARRRQQRDPQAERDHAAHEPPARRGPARVRAARGRLPGRDRPGAHGRGADRRRRHDHVHRVHGDRAQGHGARGRRRSRRSRSSSAARTR